MGPNKMAGIKEKISAIPIRIPFCPNRGTSKVNIVLRTMAILRNAAEIVMRRTYKDDFFNIISPFTIIYIYVRNLFRLQKLYLLGYRLIHKILENEDSGKINYYSAYPTGVHCNNILPI